MGGDIRYVGTHLGFLNSWPDTLLLKTDDRRQIKEFSSSFSVVVVNLENVWEAKGGKIC